MGTKTEVDERELETVPIIAHRNDRWVSSHPVRRKGNDPWAVEQCAAELQNAGYSHFIYKSDGEPAIKDFKRLGVDWLGPEM